MAQTQTKIIQNAAAATGDGLSLDLQGAAVVNVQVLITNVAEVTLECTVDRVNWSTLMMISRADSAVTNVINVSNSGIFWANVHGLMGFRARVSSRTSGTITAIASSYTVE